MSRMKYAIAFALALVMALRAMGAASAAVTDGHQGSYATRYRKRHHEARVGVPGHSGRQRRYAGLGTPGYDGVGGLRRPSWTRRLRRHASGIRLRIVHREQRSSSRRDDLVNRLYAGRDAGRRLRNDELLRKQ